MNQQTTMDVSRLNSNLQTLKEQLKSLIAASAELIERNSLIDSCSGSRLDNLGPAPKFESKLEDFLSSCVMIEANLKTMQECIQQGRASAQNLPITLSNQKCDAPEMIVEPMSQVSYNQYINTIKYQVDTAKALRSTLIDFVEGRTPPNQNQQLNNT